MDELWRRMRSLPAWGQALLWLVAWPVLGGLFFWRSTIRYGKAVGVVVLVFGLGFYGSAFTSSSEPVAVDRTQRSTPTASPTPTVRASPSVAPSPEAEGPTVIAATVIRTIDGDTFVVDLGGREERVRFIGVDTPERGEPYAGEATRFTEKQAPDASKVWLELDVEERDRYGRLLAYVWLEQPRAGSSSEARRSMLNALLALRGWAVQLTIPPNVAYADLFTTLVAEAREAGRGIWAPEPSPTPTATKTATKSPSVQVTVRFLDVRSPVKRGGQGYVKVGTTGGARCSIVVTYKSGPSTAQGLDTKTAASDGTISWSWTVGTRTTPGDWPIDATCSKDGKSASKRTTFRVIA